MNGLVPEQRMQLYDDLFSGDLLGLFTTSLTGRWLNCNNALAKLLGYDSREELLTIPLAELYFDLGERQRFIEILQEKKRLNNYEILLKRRDGSAVHVLENVVIREMPGRASVIEGVVIDITHLRRSELEQRVLAANYRQLTEHIKDGLLVIKNGRISFANGSAEKLLGGVPLAGQELLPLVADQDRERMGRLLQDAENGEDPAEERIEFQAKSGDTRPLVVHAVRCWHLDGPALQLTLQDMEAEQKLMAERLRATMAEEINAVLRKEIAEHKRTQEALSKSRRMAQSLIDSSLDMIVAVDQQNRITQFNPAATIKFGYEQDEVLGRNSRILYESDEEFTRIQNELNRFGAYAGEVRNITREGRTFVSFLAASRILDEDANVLGSMGVSRDVTQAKQDREALRQSEERYRDLVDNANDLIITVDPQGKFLFVNRAWEKAMGYTEKDRENLSLYDLIVEDSKREKAHTWMAGHHDKPVSEPWQATFRAKDGRLLHCEGISSIREENGKVVMVRSILRDITESQAAQEMIRRHSAKEKALFESSEHLFWTVDKRIALTSFNQGYHDMIVRLHGKPPRIQPDPKEPKELFATKDYHDFWRTKYDLAFKGEKVRFETRVHDTEGKLVCNEIFLSPVFNADGEVEEVFGVGIEVTSEREAEALVREQAAKLEAIFENSADVMIWSLDRNFTITACNRFFIANTERIYNRRIGQGDNIQLMFSDVISVEQNQEWIKAYGACFAGKEIHTEARVTLNDGTAIWLELFMSPIREGGTINEVSCLAHDITEKKLTEKAIADSLREKEVLLKEVHHRVKNNLQIISSIFSLQRDHVDGDERLLTLLQESKDRIRSMSYIHESLYQNKNFSHVDMVRYIDGLCGNLAMSYSLNGRIRLATDLQPLLLDIDKAIPCGLVLNELISNALKHAFPDGREGRISIAMHEEGKTVVIRLADDGVGFPEGRDEEERGLGLELVQLLMEQLDGKAVRERASPLKGTAYLITFERT